MTSSLRPAAAILPLLLAVLLLPGSRVLLRAADDDAAPRRAAAEELLKAMNTGQTVTGASKRMLTSMDGMADRMGKQPNLTPEQTADIQKFREDIHSLVEQQLGWDAVKPDVVQAYAEDFTAAELKEMIAFYRTPAGQKLVEKQPELSEKLGKAMQAKSMTLMPTIRQKIQAINARVHPAPVAPPIAPLGMPAASPGSALVLPRAATTPPSTVTTAPVAAPTTAPVESPKP